MLLTAEQAAEKLSISVGTFLRAVARGELPPPSVRGRPHYWSWDRIEKYLAEGPPTIPTSCDRVKERALDRLQNEIC